MQKNLTYVTELSHPFKSEEADQSVCLMILTRGQSPISENYSESY